MTAPAPPHRLLLLLAWPALILSFIVGVPLAVLARVSLAPSDPGGLWGSGTTWVAYGQALGTLGTLCYSLALAVAVAALGLMIGFPLTYLLTRMGGRAQAWWMVFLLVTLSLSDVLVAFSWQIMLSKRVGLPHLLVMLGVLDQAVSLVPSNGAVVSCLLYLAVPFSVLTLYPGLSQLDHSLVEAARSMGATPLRAMTSVVLPLCRGPALTTFSTSTVLTLGAYVAPVVLGRPEDWTIAVLINRTALSSQDLPQAAAMSFLLLLVTLFLVVGLRQLAKRGETR